MKIVTKTIYNHLDDVAVERGKALAAGKVDALKGKSPKDIMAVLKVEAKRRFLEQENKRVKDLLAKATAVVVAENLRIEQAGKTIIPDNTPLSAEEEKAQHIKFFDMIKNKLDWKTPIKASIRPQDYDGCAAACWYFTGSALRIRTTINGRHVVEAAGYYIMEQVS